MHKPGAAVQRVFVGDSSRAKAVGFRLPAPLARTTRAIALIAALAMLGVGGVHAQSAPIAPVFAPASATATAVAKAAQAAETPTAGQCPTGNVCVAFGAFSYALDPDCLDQHYIIGLRTEQDPQTGDDVSYVRLLTFLKAGADGWTIVPQPENKASGPDAGKPLGARLCAGEGGSQ